jgi:molecular chaperone DnaJ
VKDYYFILDVTENASFGEIKKAYRVLAQKYHPDRNQGDKRSEDIFKEINEAYETLTDPYKKAEYDNNMQHHRRFKHVDDYNFESSYRESNFVKHPFVDSIKNEKKKKPSINLKIDLDDLESGRVDKKIRIKKKIKCVSCDGVGGDYAQRCTNCSGLGFRYNTIKDGDSYVKCTIPCQICASRGKLFSGVCSVCFGNGTIVEEEIYYLEITCKKKDTKN